MENGAELTLEQAVDVVKRQYRRKSGEPGINYVGDRLLSCAVCESPMAGGHPGGGWYPDPRRACYHCTGCGEVTALVTVVHRELQSLTRQRLTDSSVISTWRAERLSTLDTELAELRAVLAWGRDERRCAELGHKLGPIRGSGRRAAVDEALSSLDHAALHLADLIAEHAALSETAKNADDVIDVSQLRQAWREFAELAFPLADLRRRTTPRQEVRILGGRRRHGAYQAELHRLRLSFWDLLLHTEWHNPEPAQLPAQHEALTQDWAASPASESGLRRKLLLIALGDDRLVIKPGPRVNGVAGERVKVISAR